MTTPTLESVETHVSMDMLNLLEIVDACGCEKCSILFDSHVLDIWSNTSFTTIPMHTKLAVFNLDMKIHTRQIITGNLANITAFVLQVSPFPAV